MPVYMHTLKYRAHPKNKITAKIHKSKIICEFIIM